MNDKIFNLDRLINNLLELHQFPRTLRINCKSASFSARRTTPSAYNRMDTDPSSILIPLRNALFQTTFNIETVCQKSI